MGELGKLERKKKKSAMDAWRNIMTGLGTKKDKSTYAEIDVWRSLGESVQESLYARDEAAKKCAVLIPNEAVREGISWNMDETKRHEEIMKFLDREFDRLDVFQALKSAWVQANVHGGACVLMVVDDGARSLASALKPEKVKSVKALRVFNRYELEVWPTEIITDFGSEYYGQPKYYYYNTSVGDGTDTKLQVKIHHSRLLRFDGVELPRKLYIDNGYWHDSIYTGLYTALKNYGTVHDALSTMVYDFQTPLYKIEGLSQALSEDDNETIVKRVQIANLTKSVSRALVLDKEDDFENTSVQVSGLSELVELTIQRLVVGMQVPKTIFLGVSPSGLSGTGYSEMVAFFDNVKGQQQTKLRKPIERITELLFAEDGSEEKPEGLTFIFNPLFQLDRETEQKARLLQSQIDEKYITKGVLSREEVTQSRFGHGRYNYETILDDSLGERVSLESGGGSPSDLRPSEESSKLSSEKTSV